MNAEISAQTKKHFLTRAQIFVASAMGLGIWFSRRFCAVQVFPDAFYSLALASSLFHAVLALGFNRCSSIHFNIAGFVNLVMLGLVVHYTGGILSPFNFIFIAILISGSAYDVPHWLSIGLGVAIYLIVVSLEFSGLLTSCAISPSIVYKSPVTTWAVVVAVVGFMVLSGNIYEITVKVLRRKLQEEQVRVQEMLTRIARMEAQSQFGMMVAKIAHDIRGPLGAIRGFVDAMEITPGIDPVQKEDCGIMRGEIIRINEMLSRMLKFVKPGAESKEDVDVREALDILLSVIRYYPGGRGVDFRSSLPEPGACTLFADKNQFQQIYFNLLKNAVEAVHGQRPAHVKVSAARKEDGSTEIWVVDNGPGFSDEVLKAKPSKLITTKKDGHGFGLGIVREILSSYGAEMRVSAAPGGGAAVCTTWPAPGKASPVIFVESRQDEIHSAKESRT
ncbi:MAG: ATP-binding protein [Elusimicrobiota bacterium]|jgi:signal transduction histidine kinase